MTRDFKISSLIVFVSALVFIPFTGRLHLFDWDEINFAESAREMLVTGDYMTVRIFFEPFWEKPPLFIWLQVISMKLFGVNEFAARFPNAIAGIFTLLILYKLGRKMLNENFGLIWALAYGTAMLPFLYFKSGIIDPWFNLFIFLGIYYFYSAQIEQRLRHKYLKIALSAFFIGLATLTKGPVAILIFGLTVFILLLIKRFKLYLNFGQIMTFIGVLIFTGGFWFILQILSGNWQTIVDFINYQIRLLTEKDAGHGGFPLYHFVILFFGVFPASVFVIYAHRKKYEYKENQNYFHTVMLTLFWVVLILFSIVKTKIVHYSSLCYFPMSFLAAYGIYSLINVKKKVPRWINGVLGIVGVIIGLIIIGFSIFDHYKQWFIDTGKITQAFTVGNLQADLNWTGFETLIGIIFIGGTITGIVFFVKKQLTAGFSLIAFTSGIFIFLSVLFLAPKIEMYSQNAAIEFFKSFKNKDVYVQPFYKSYAKLFYTNAKKFDENHPFILYWKKNQKRLGNRKDLAFTLWLARGDIDKDAYFVIRADKKAQTLNKYKELKVLSEKNGYVFCIRKAKHKIEK